MLVASLLIGLFTAYYFGLRPGAYAAAATVGLLITAMVVPGWAVPVYLALAAGVGAVAWIGPRRKEPPVLAATVKRARVLIDRLIRRRMG